MTKKYYKYTFQANIAYEGEPITEIFLDSLPKRITVIARDADEAWKKVTRILENPRMTLMFIQRESGLFDFKDEWPDSTSCLDRKIIEIEELQTKM